MCDCFFPLDGDELFDDVMKPLEQRRPRAIEFLRRVGCIGLYISRVSSGSIELKPLMSAPPATFLTLKQARELGMTDEEEAQFEEYQHAPDKLAFSEPWTWKPPRYFWQKALSE